MTLYNRVMEPWKNVTETSERAAFRAAGVYEASREVGNLSERYTQAAKAIMHVARKLLGPGELTFFVSEQRGEKSAEFGLVWAFGEDLVICSNAALDLVDSEIKIYRPSRDFHGVEITGHDTIQDAPFPRTSKLEVSILGPNSLQIKMEASGTNCATLYDVLPLLTGRQSQH